jgi:hypothetical protein
MENLRDNAGELISQDNLLKKFKEWIFEIIWYKPWENEADLIEYLTTYRMFQEQILKKSANNIDYKATNYISHKTDRKKSA